MFSTKIYALSVFVFCLFNLGQAAPIIDEVSSLSAREPILEARGIFDFLHPNDKVTQKKVDNATDIGACHLYNTYTELKKTHQNSLKEIKAKLTSAKDEKKAVKKAYAKVVKDFKNMIKDAGKKASEQKKLIEKHGGKVTTRCAPPSSSHTDSHTLAATSQHHESSHSSSHSGSPEN